MPTEPNPYAPPREHRPRRKRRRAAKRAPGDWVKWAYAAVAGVSALAFFVIASGWASGQPTQQRLISLVDGPLSWSTLGLGLVWVYCAWSGLPPRFSGRISPAGALVRFIIPIYSLYWVFGVNLQLCDGLNSALSVAEDARRAPKALAMGATVLHFLPLVMLATDAKAYAFLGMIAANALWFTYMWQCDPLRGAVWNAEVQR